MPLIDIKVEISENGRKKPEYSLDTDLNGEVTLQELLEFTRQSLIVIADATLTEEQTFGFDKEPVLTVDGITGRPIQKVNPLGQIEFTSRINIEDLLITTYSALLDRSKVDTGRYKSSHYVFLNGAQVATDLDTLNNWLNTSPEFKNSDIIRIVNIQPYARKLERLGVTAQRSNPKTSHRRGDKTKSKPKVIVPNGTYALTVRAIKGKFKRNSNIRFTFLPGSSLGLSGSFKGGRKGRNSSGRPYLYPTIVITLNERGLNNV